MKKRPEDLYLTLMKNTLSFMLWPEPPIPVETFNYRNPPAKRFWVAASSRILKKAGLTLVKDRKFSEKKRIEGHVWPGYADTMIGLKRLDNLQFCIETTINDGIEGDLIETGVWRGGATIFMRAVLAAYGIEDRKVFVADSFEGLPKPDAEKHPADKDDTHHIHNFLAISQEQVENNFKKYDLLDDQVIFLKGWFKDTLPTAPITKLSILRLDGDMYSSTMDALNSLYPKLSNGGFCIIDDYALSGCKKAVDDYREEHEITAELKQIDWSGFYWRKD